MSYKFLDKDGLAKLISLIKGDLTALKESQTSTNNEIASLKSYVSDKKSGIASAVTGMGQLTASDATFDDIINNILLISSDATSGVSDVLSGKTFYQGGTKKTGTMANNGAVKQSLNAGGTYTIPVGYHNGLGVITANSLASQTSATASAPQILSGQTAYVNGTKLTGTMTNNGSVTSSLNAGGSYTIPIGYHDGTGKITANSLSSQTSGTATASDMLSGKTAWVNGAKVTGSISSLGVTSYTPTTTDITISASQYLSGAQTIVGDANLLTANIKAGVSIFGVAGKSSVVETSDATATASQILLGKIAYVNGAKITGTIASKGTASYTPTTTAQTISAGVYLSGAQTIAGDTSLVSANIKSGASIFGVTGSASVVDTSDATATASQMLSGVTAYVKGSKVTGTISSKGATTYTPTTTSQTISSGVYLSGAQTIAGDTNLVSANIKKGISIFGVTGTLLGGEIEAGDTGATADTILTGYVAYVNGVRVAGTMTNNGAVSSSLNAGASYTIPKGYHSGTGKVTANSLSSQTSATATAGHILSGYTAWVNGTKLTGTIANYMNNSKAYHNTDTSFTTLPGYYWFGDGTEIVEGATTPSTSTNTTGHAGGAVALKIAKPGYYDTSSIVYQNMYGLNPSVIKHGNWIGVGSSTVTGTYTSDATATAGDLLSGKIAYVKGEKVTGSMPNQGAVTSSLNAGSVYTIPAGYHNGSGKITANSLSSQTSATASATQLLSGATAWVNGSKITGTMSNRGSVSSSLNAGVSYTIPQGYHDGTGKVTANSLASQTSATAGAGDILATKTAWINGVSVTGTMTNRGAVTSSLNAGATYTIPQGYHSGTGVITANSLASQTSATASAGNILTGQTAWVNGVKVTGTMTNNGAVSSALNAGGSYTIPAGYHSGSGKVTANSLSSQTSATATASDIVSGKTAWVSGTRITGTLNPVTEIYNFPLTFSTTQPTPLREGHVWISSSTSSNYSNIQIVEAVDATIPNSSLIFVVGDMVFRKHKTTQNKLVQDGTKKTFTVEDDTLLDPNAWMVSSITDGMTHNIYFRLPLVYSKINNTLNVETTSIWNGTKWVNLSTKGEFLAYLSKAGLEVYAKGSDNLTYDYTIALDNTSDNAYANIYTSKDCGYIVYNDKLYRKVDGSAKLIFTPPTSYYVNSITYSNVTRTSFLTHDDKYFVKVLYNTSVMKTLLLFYKIDGDTATLSTYVDGLPVNYGYNGDTISFDSGGAICLMKTDYTSTNQYCYILHPNADGTYEAIKFTNISPYIGFCKFVDGLLFVTGIFGQSVSEGYYKAFRYNYSTKTLTQVYSILNSTGGSRLRYINEKFMRIPGTTIFMYYYSQKYYGIDISTGVEYTVNATYPGTNPNWYGSQIGVDGKLYSGYWESSKGYMLVCSSISISGTTITITPLYQKEGIANMYTYTSGDSYGTNNLLVYPQYR